MILPKLVECMYTSGYTILVEGCMYELLSISAGLLAESPYVTIRVGNGHTLKGHARRFGINDFAIQYLEGGYMGNEIEEFKKELICSLKSSLAGMFASMDSVKKAMDYNEDINKYGSNPSTRITGLMVYHNTVIDSIIKNLES